MGETPLLRPHPLRSEEDDGSDEPLAAATRGRPERSPVPHLLPGLRIACFTSFAGGVGKTTLAVEVATLVAARARYRTLEGEELPAAGPAARCQPGHGRCRRHPPRARRRGAVAGLEPGPLAPPAGGRGSRGRTSLGGRRRDRARPIAMTLGSELQPEPERDLFRADHVDDFCGGAQEEGYQLLVVDLGSHLEDGHRHLVDRADLVLGVVRPTLESLPDVHRLANVSRGMGAGRKLTLVANLADDDTAVRAHAHDYGLPIAGAVPMNPTFVAACERGEPAWSLDPAIEGAVRGVAATVWPLLTDGAPSAHGRGLLGSARRLATLGRGTER